MDGALEERLLADIQAHESWYHTLELATGVTTAGWFDTRSVAVLLPIPERLDGQRCLDIGTFDGFWAFEMERRGAAEVLAIDLLDPDDWDWPVRATHDVIAAVGSRKGRGAGFELAHKALGSSVERREMSVYDLDPEEVGEFDFIYLGSLLLHLQNPIAAIERVRSVCRGLMISVDAIDAGLSALHRRRPVAEIEGMGRPWWWKPNAAGHERMIVSGGFTPIREQIRFRMPRGLGQPLVPLRPRVLRNKSARNAFWIARIGDPHAAVLARPT